MPDIQQDVTEEPFVPVVNEEQMKKLGTKLFSMFKDYQKDRRECEQQWLKNLRQFKGIYDPEIEGSIGADQSRAYPKITRSKVIGTDARLMEMLFPQTEKNWAIEPSPMPDLGTEDLQAVLDQLAMEQQGEPLTDDAIEKAIFSFAKVKAERLDKVMTDQLAELDYVQMAKKVIHSGVMNGPGVMKGPLVKRTKGRTWVSDPLTGKLTAREIEKLAPLYEPLDVWAYYPDMSAKSFDQMDGQFERHVNSRAEFRKLAQRPDFMGDVIKKYLAENKVGNYKEQDWETQLRSKGDRANVSDISGRKIEWWEFWGHVSGHELRACGINVPEEDLGAEVQACLCGVDGLVIKALLHPYSENVRMYHTFIYEEDDISLLGSGLPTVIRDSQMAICEASRALLDNASVVCGPQLEINMDRIAPGQSLDIHAFKIWWSEGTGAESSTPMVRPIAINSHIAELSGIIELFMGFADTEAALPPPALGDVSGQGKEAFRTSSGTSMLLGAAALPIRNTVRNFDVFTNSVITSLAHWNMEMNPDADIKGDYTVIARGSTSLVAKELRAVTLNQFSLSLQPEERMHISTRKMLVKKMQANDIDPDILEDEEVVNKKLEEQAQQAQAQAKIDAEVKQSEIREAVAGAFKDIALANAASARTTIDSFNAVVEGVKSGREAEQRAGSEAKANSTPSAA